MPRNIEIRDLKGMSSCLRVLSTFLYQAEIPGTTRFNNGLVICHTSSYCKEFGSIPAYFVLYLQLLSSVGLIHHLKLTRGYARFYISRPPIFNYADTQAVPEGSEQMTDEQLRQHALGRAEYKAEKEHTILDIMEKLELIERKVSK